MRIINVHQAKTHLSKLLDQVKAGEVIVLAKMGKPYAKLVPLEEPSSVPLGFLKGELSDGFFEPLSEAELAEWEGPIFP